MSLLDVYMLPLWNAYSCFSPFLFSCLSFYYSVVWVHYIFYNLYRILCQMCHEYFLTACGWLFQFLSSIFWWVKVLFKHFWWSLICLSFNINLECYCFLCPIQEIFAYLPTSFKQIFPFFLKFLCLDLWSVSN